jgi:hypothetical protein
MSIMVGDLVIEHGAPWAMPGGPVEGLDWLAKKLRLMEKVSARTISC